MADNDPKLALHGKDVTITVFVGGRPIEGTDNAQSITVNEVNTQHVDKLLGRTQDRLDETPGHFEIALDLLYAGSALYAALQAQKAKRAANTFVENTDGISLGMVWVNRDGTESAYTAVKCTTNQTLKVGGKDEAVMQSLKLQCEKFTEQEL